MPRRVWVARCDPQPENRTLAASLWTSASLSAGPGLCLSMLSDVCHPVAVVRSAAAEALAALLEDNGEETGEVLVQLLDMYQV